MLTALLLLVRTQAGSVVTGYAKLVVPLGLVVAVARVMGLAALLRALGTLLLTVIWLLEGEVCMQMM
jgi:hypothetical protein